MRKKGRAISRILFCWDGIFSPTDSHSSRSVVTNTLTRSRAQLHCGELAIDEVPIGLHRIGFIVPYVAVKQPPHSKWRFSLKKG